MSAILHGLLLLPALVSAFAPVQQGRSAMGALDATRRLGIFGGGACMAATVCLAAKLWVY